MCPKRSILAGRGHCVVGELPVLPCRYELAHADQGLAAYTIPRIDVAVTGTYQRLPAPVPDLSANFAATNAYLAANSTLGRPLAGGAQNITVNLVEPGTVFGPSLNQVDLRFAKILRFGRRGRRSTSTSTTRSTRTRS